MADHAGNLRLRTEFSPCSQGGTGRVRAQRTMPGLRVEGSGRYRSPMDILPEKNRAPEVVLVHSSDLHVDEDRVADSRGGDGTAGLRSVLATGRAVRADIVLLAGDTFESNQLGPAVLDRAGRLLAAAGMPVVI